MESSKKDFIYSHSEYLNNYIQFADTKSAVFITVNGVLMGFLYAQLKTMKPLNLLESKQVFLILCIVLLLISYVFLFLVIFPRRNYKNGKGIIFWDDISKNKDVESYINQVSSIEDGKIEEIMLEQNYYLAKTATKKYMNLHLSFIFSISSYILLVVFCVLSLF